MSRRAETDKRRGRREEVEEVEEVVRDMHHQHHERSATHSKTRGALATGLDHFSIGKTRTASLCARTRAYRDSRRSPRGLAHRQTWAVCDESQSAATPSASTIAGKAPLLALLGRQKMSNDATTRRGRYPGLPFPPPPDGGRSKAKRSEQTKSRPPGNNATQKLRLSKGDANLCSTSWCCPTS